MSNLVQFQSFCFNSNAVRVITDPTGEFWFCGKDICTILGYINESLTLQKHCKENGVSKRYLIDKMQRKQEAIFINEPNLYRLIIKSRKPEAEPFEAWVFEEVLPQIRKTGQYSLQNSQPNLPLEEVQQDEEALHIIVNLFHSLNGAYEMGRILCQREKHLAQEISKQVGEHYLYNLNFPTQNALDKARKYIHAKSERIMFVKGMLSLLEEPKRIAN